MKMPMTRSCIVTVLEKPIVQRTRRLVPGPQIEVFALDFLCMLLANLMLLWVDMPLVGPPPIRVKPRETKRLQQRLSLQKDRILASPKNVGQHGPTVVINRMPQPPRLRFLAHVTPDLIEL